MRATVQQILEPVRDYILRQHDRLRGVARPDPDILLRALAFHSTRGTLAVVRDGSDIAGLAVAFQRNETDIRARGEDVFDWRESDPAGDSVYLALVITTQPNAMPVLAGYFLDHFPTWEYLKCFAHRRSRLVRRDHLLSRLARPTTKELVYG